MGAIIGLLVGAPGDVEAMILRAVGGGLAGLMISSCFYLLLVTKDLALAQIPKADLNDSEAVLLKNAGSMVHYKTGRPLRFWEAVGGTLFLTDQALVFRAHKGQPRNGGPANGATSGVPRAQGTALDLLGDRSD